MFRNQRYYHLLSDLYTKIEGKWLTGNGIYNSHFQAVVNKISGHFRSFTGDNGGKKSTEAPAIYYNKAGPFTSFIF